MRIRAAKVLRDNNYCLPLPQDEANLTESRKNMADNYIEKQYEQYEARKAAWKQSQKYRKKRDQHLRRLKQRVEPVKEGYS